MRLKLRARAKEVVFILMVACIYLTVRIFIFNERTLRRPGRMHSEARKVVPEVAVENKRPEDGELLQNLPAEVVQNPPAEVVQNPPAEVVQNPRAEVVQNPPAEVVQNPARGVVPNKQDHMAVDGGAECDQSAIGVPESVRRQQGSDVSAVTCRALLYENATEKGAYETAKAFMKKYPFTKIKDEEFIELARDCEAFKRERGYHVHAASQNEAAFPLAYNVLVHKDVHQVEHLLRAIYRPQNVYCLHADAKQPQVFHRALAAIAGCLHNVYIASKLERVVYAGYSRLQADINCMRDQVDHSVPWRYLINIAGQSFPLKTNEEIVNILRIYNGANDIEGIYGRRILRSRFENEWNESDGKLDKTGRKNPAPPHDIEIVRGSAYGIFSRKFVEFIVTDERAKALLDWSRNTYSPDEHYWATLHHTYGNPHLKTPGGFAGKPDSKPWMAVWVAWGGVDKCHGMWRRGTCVFGVEDLPQLLPHHELFANKFYIDYEYLALECLNNWIEYKVTCPAATTQYEFYRQLPYIYKANS